MDKGVIIEYDFAAIAGADLLFATAKEFFDKLDGIAFDTGLEARFLAGQTYLIGMTDFLQFVKTKKTAAKAAKDLPVAFQKALTAKIRADGLAPEFVEAVKALEAKGVKVVITTRANVDQAAEAFAPVLSDQVKLHFENSVTYGNVKWDAWRRAAKAHGLDPQATVAVTGSGYGVKSALLGGFHAAVVQTPHVAWQDFGGANCVSDKFDSAFAAKLMKIMKIA